MLLAWIIFVLLVLYSLYDIKKAIIIWFPLRLLFNPQIALRYASPAMSLDIAVSLWLVFLYFIKCRGREGAYNMSKGSSFISLIFVAYFVSYGLSFLFSFEFTLSVFTKSFKIFVMFFGLVYIFQKALKSEKDIKLFVYTTGVVIFLISALGIYQIITNDNPFLDYVYMNSPHDETTEGRMYYVPPGISDHVRLRYGMIRCGSFFSFSVPFGVACVIFVFLVGFMLKNNLFKTYKVYLYIALILLCTCVVISNTKQAYIGLIIVALCFFSTKEIFSYRLLIILIVLIVLWNVIPNIFNNYFSLFDAELAEEGGGSSVALRQSQYAIAYDMFAMNPVFGNGPFSLEALSKIDQNYEGILGAESIFLKILPERGLIGVVVYFYMFYVLYTKMKRVIPLQQLLFFLFTYFVMEVAGGQKDMTLFFGVLVAAGKMMQIKMVRRLENKIIKLQ